MRSFDRGWMVLECGEACLSETCAKFPRNVRSYGDVFEASVEIVCPVAARYLLENVPIKFLIQEKETNVEIKVINYQIYDSLALARSESVEMMQSLSGHFTTGKLYMVFSVFNKITPLYNFCYKKE